MQYDELSDTPALDTTIILLLLIIIGTDDPFTTAGTTVILLRKLLTYRWCILPWQHYAVHKSGDVPDSF